MRFFWKMLLAAIPLGSYWLYKKSGSPTTDTEMQSEQTEENKPTSQSPAAVEQDEAGPKREADPSPKKKEGEKEVPTAQIIKRLTEIDGVTSRVAENLVEKGIHSKEELTALSKEELMEIKGIGPKRAARILNLR